MQFNSSLNKQKSILALTEATKEQRVQELSLSVTRMSPDGVCVQAGDWEKERKRLLRITIYRSFTLSLLWILILTRPQTTSQVQVKLIHSLSTLSTNAMDERKQDMLALRMEKRIMMGKEDKKL